MPDPHPMKTDREWVEALRREDKSHDGTPCPSCGKVGIYTLDSGGCCFVECPNPR